MCSPQSGFFDQRRGMLNRPVRCCERALPRIVQGPPKATYKCGRLLRGNACSQQLLQRVVGNLMGVRAARMASATIPVRDGHSHLALAGNKARTIGRLGDQRQWHVLIRKITPTE